MSLALHGVDVTLGRRTAVHGVTATLRPGALIGIIGPNGAGKSTLVRAMLGLVPPSAGAVELDGRPIASLSRGEVARALAYLPQGQTLHWPISVERLVALGRLPHLAPLSRISGEDRAAIKRALAKADLSGLRDRTATELSGGERARALLGRAFAVEAPGLVVDEPLAALDPAHQLQVMTLLKRQAAEGALVVAVLHDLSMAARFCDRLLLMAGGALLADGPPAAVLTPDRLSAAYGISAVLGEVAGAPVVVPFAARPLPDAPRQG